VAGWDGTDLEAGHVYVAISSEANEIGSQPPDQYVRTLEEPGDG
jgi:hypothetical protein